jgi:hypothetical protein
VKATFHERQYELAVNLELIAESGKFFAPMQVIEENVGYDIALVPGYTAVWTQLGVGKQPPGVYTATEYDAALKPVPGGHAFAASLFVQYKRPERMVRRSAAEASRRQSQGGDVPFFRVRLNADQHDVLADLENRVGADAVVRYAAPLFHRIEDLWVRQATRSVFPGSAFIAPSDAGNPPSCWTYDDKGAPIFCSVPRRGESEQSYEVLSALVRAGVAKERPEIGAHLRILAAEVGEVDLTSRKRRRRIDDDDRTDRERRDDDEWVRPPLPRVEWVERLRAAAPEQTDAEIDAAVDAALVANTAASIGITWLLAEIRPRAVVA